MSEAEAIEETLLSEEDVQVTYGLSWRAVVLAFLCLLLSLIWMKQAGLVSHGAQLGESVPVVPAMSFVMTTWPPLPACCSSMPSYV